MVITDIWSRTDKLKKVRMISCFDIMKQKVRRKVRMLYSGVLADLQIVTYYLRFCYF